MRHGRFVRAFGGLPACATLVALAASPAQAVPAHGDLVHIVNPRLAFQPTQSNNWFGYNQGLLEQGVKPFHSISGQWTVPAASQHKRGESENSSTWIGIGGGCIDAGCTATDSTLIQTGTEQDVGSNGSPSYSAWWEIIPAPSTPIAGLPVVPGDTMRATIAETIPNSEVWTITLTNVTRHKSFTTTTPYPSTYGSAEWIEETPLLIDTSGSGLAALPNLTRSVFDNGTANAAPAKLKASERMVLVDSSGHQIGTPSNPDSDASGFAACAWTTSCAVPAS